MTKHHIILNNNMDEFTFMITHNNNPVSKFAYNVGDCYRKSHVENMKNQFEKFKTKLVAGKTNIKIYWHAKYEYIIFTFSYKNKKAVLKCDIKDSCEVYLEIPKINRVSLLADINGIIKYLDKYINDSEDNS